jgi:hypothetical protein
MRAALIIAMTTAVAVPAQAEAPVLRPIVSAMVGVDGEPCSSLLSDIKDGCKRLAKHAEPSFDAEVFQAGTRRGIRRLVLVVKAGDQRMASPGIVLDLVSTFYRGNKSDRFQTESLVGCAPTADGPWKCSKVELGSCSATLGPDGSVESSCGPKASLSFAR